MQENNPLISVVIPSRANNYKILHNIISCLENQTFKEFEIIIICDREFNETDRDEFLKNFSETKLKLTFLSNNNSKFTPHSKGGASYVRNFGIDHAKGEYIQLFDDDNKFENNYLEKALEFYKKFKKQYNKEVFITPTLIRRDTDKIQNQGFSGYNYRQARPQIHFLEIGQEYSEIKMFSGNGVFGKKEIMQKVHYDEQIARIAEDLDFTYSINKLGYPILVFKDLKVYHQERDKTILEEAWIGSKTSAKQKIRNIFLRGKKHANFHEKIILYLRSTRGICGRLSVKAYIYGKKSKREIIKGILSGYLEGWKLTIFPFLK